MANTDAVFMLAFTFEFHTLDAITAKSVGGGKLGSHKLTLLVNGYDTARVITPRFQYLQSLDAHLSCLRLITNVSNDTTALVTQVACTKY
jgi:hypothetical protein